MSEPDILRIYKESNSSKRERQLEDLRQYVKDRNLKILDVANEHDYNKIKSSEVFGRLPLEERRLFEGSTSLQDFLMQFDVILNSNLPGYFITRSEEESIGVQIQSSSDVAVQETSFVDSAPYVYQLKKTLSTMKKARIRTKSEVDNEITKLRKGVNDYLGAIRHQLDGLPSMVSFVALFDPLIRNQLHYESQLSPTTRNLMDNLYTMYLSRESPRLREFSILRRQPYGTLKEGLSLENLITPIPSRSFHDVVGRRLLILSSPEEFNRENTLINTEIHHPDVPEDFLASHYGYSDIYSGSGVFVRLFADLVDMVRRYCDKYNLNDYKRYKDLYIDRIKNAGLLPLLVDRRQLPPASAPIDADLTVLQDSPVDRRVVANAYRNLLINDGIDTFQQEILATIQVLYPKLSSRIHDMRLPEPIALFSNEHMIATFERRLRTIRKEYEERLPIVLDTRDEYVFSALLMCRAQVRGFFRLLTDPLSFANVLVFLQRKTDLIGNLGEGQPEYMDYVDPLTTRTTYAPFTFVTPSMHPVHTMMAVYLYHLLIAVHNLSGPPMSKQEFIASKRIEHANMEDVSVIVAQYEDQIATLLYKAYYKPETLDGLEEITYTIRYPITNITIPRGANFTLGAVTKATQGEIFWSSDPLYRVRHLRFYELFDQLMNYTSIKKFEPSTVLLYMYLRFTETWRGVDSTFTDRTFETWAAMISHKHSIDSGDHTDIIARKIEEESDYSKERSPTYDVSIIENTNDEFSEKIFHGLSARTTLSFSGLFWCQYEIFTSLSTKTDIDLLVGILTLNGSYTDALSLQLYVLASVEVKLRRSTVAVLIPRFSYISDDLTTTVSWTKVKSFLWELHPVNILSTVLAILHYTTDYARRDDKSASPIESYAPIAAVLAPLRNQGVSSGAFDSREWIRDVMYTNADHYINTAHIKQISMFEQTLAAFDNTVSGASSIATTLNFYTQHVDEAFFNIWLEVFPNDFFSSQIDRFIGNMFTAYNERANKIMPHEQNIIPEDIFLAMKVHTPRYTSARFLSEVYELPDLYTYSIATYLQILGLFCRLVYLKNKRQVLDFLRTEPNVESVGMYSGEDRRYFMDVFYFFSAHKHFMHKGDFFRRCMAFTIELLADESGGKLTELVDFTEIQKKNALIHAVRRTRLVDMKRARLFIETDVVPTTLDDIYPDLVAYTNAMKTINKGILKVNENGSRVYYYRKQLLLEATKQLFTSSEELTEDNKKVLDLLLNDYAQIFIRDNTPLSGHFEQFLLDRGTSISFARPLFTYLLDSQDEEFVHKQLIAIVTALKTIDAIYNKTIGVFVHVMRWICTNAKFRTNVLYFLANIINARANKITLQYMNHEPPIEGTPPYIMALLDTALETGYEKTFLYGMVFDSGRRPSKDELDAHIGSISLQFVYPDHDADIVTNGRRSKEKEPPQQVMAMVDEIASHASIRETTTYLLEYAIVLAQGTVNLRHQVLISELAKYYQKLISDTNFINDLYHNKDIFNEMIDRPDFSDAVFQQRIHSEVAKKIRDYATNELLLPETTSVRLPYLYGNSLVPRTIYRNTLARVMNKVKV